MISFNYHNFSSDSSEESPKTLFGEVINRNVLELSITLKCSYSNLIHIIYLPYWVKRNPSADGKLLPHTNNIIQIKNINWIQSNDFLRYYAGNENTTIEIRAGHNLKSMDKLVIEPDIWFETNKINLLQVLEQNNMAYKQLETYIKLPNILQNLSHSEVIKFYLFKVLAERGIMQNLTCSSGKIMYMNEEIYEIHNPTSISQCDKYLESAKEHTVPYFGNKPSSNECLVGIFTSKMGKFFIEDGESSTVLHIICEYNSDALIFCNALILITKFHVLSEIYCDGCNECILVDFEDIFILLKNNGKFYKIKSQEAYEVFTPAIINSKEELLNYADYDKQTFKLIAIAPVSKVYGQDDVEVCILIEDPSSQNQSYLCLGKDYLSTVAFLDMGRTYTLYTPHILENNADIRTLSESIACYKLNLKGGFFLAGVFDSKVFNLLTKLPHVPTMVNMKATVVSHHLNESDTRRRVPKCSYQIGMLASKFEHRLAINLEDTPCSVYLNQWETKLTPEGLNPHVIVLITHAYFNGNYLASNFMTGIKVIGVQDELKSFTTANLNSRNKQGRPEYASLVTSSLNFFVYIRTRVYVETFEGTINFLAQEFNCSFAVIEENGVNTVTCNDYKLLFKLMEISDVELYDDIEKYKHTINFSDIETILQGSDLDLLPYMGLWLQHCYLKLNYGLISMDILCKRKNERWVIEDVYSVN